ncbi:MAG: hypothetical protein EOM20_10210 [Spartobacteria bacterium]|nr:hypothetical protein [Spartobacteria bacterium]
MGKRAKLYTRLPGVGQATFGVVTASKSSLYLGPDHLLLLFNRGYAEEYKRFYYKDIQALIMQKTPAWKIQNAVLAVMTAFFGVMALVTRQSDTTWQYITGAMGVTFLIITVCNLFRGVTCRCYLQTAVQTERLFSLHHVRTAQKVFRKLRPVIEAEQGRLTADRVRDVTREWAERREATTAHAPPRHAAPNHLAEPRRYYHGRPHEVLFLLLLGDVLLSGMEFISRSVVIPYLSVVLLLATVIMLIVSLAKMRRTTMPTSLAVLLYMIIGYLFLSLTVGSACVAVSTISIHQTTHHATSQFAAWAALDPVNSVMKTVLLTVSMLISAILGMTGLLILWRYRRTSVIPEIPALPEEESAS